MKAKTGKHEFLDPEERAELAARLESQKPLKAPRKAPADPEVKRKIAEYQIAREAAHLDLPRMTLQATFEKAILSGVEPTAEAVAAWVKVTNERIAQSEALDVLETNARRGKKPLTLQRARATVKRRHAPARRWKPARPEPRDAETLAAFGRRHGEKTLRLATGWTPYRTAGKTRGHGIALKRFVDHKRPKKLYDSAARLAYRDRCLAARELLDVFAVQHDKEDIAMREMHQQLFWRTVLAKSRRRKHQRDRSEGRAG